MKILFISHSLVVGSYRKKIEMMRKNSQHEILLVVADKWNEAGRNIKATSNGFIALPTLRLMNYHGATFFYSFKILSIIRNFRPDIIHVEEEHFSLALFQIILLKRLFQPKSKVLFFTWQNISKNYGFPFSWIEKFNLKYSNFAIVGNREAKDILREKGFKKQIAIIPQVGIDIQDYTQSKKGHSKGKKIIGFLGRFEQEKGLDVLIRAVSELSFDFELWLVGKGTYQQNALKFLKKLDLMQRTHFFPNVSHDEVPKLLGKLDVLILPSITTSSWKEQFGRVLIEAMATGVPVIGSDSGAIPEVIGDAGLIFREGDFSELAAKIDFLFRDKNCYMDLVQKGRWRVEQEYSIDKIADNTLKLYAQLLQRT